MKKKTKKSTKTKKVAKPKDETPFMLGWDAADNIIDTILTKIPESKDEERDEAFIGAFRSLSLTMSQVWKNLANELAIKKMAQITVITLQDQYNFNNNIKSIYKIYILIYIHLNNLNHFGIHLKYKCSHFFF